MRNKNKRVKKLSKTELIEALQIANPNITVTGCDFDDHNFYMKWSEEVPLKVTDQLIVRALGGWYFYLPDRPKVESLLREILAGLNKKDAIIMRVVCGIDNPLPKNLKESVEILKKRGVTFSSENIFSETSLRGRVREIGTIMKKRLSKTYKSSCCDMAESEIVGLKITDFVRLDSTYTKFDSSNNHIKKRFERLGNKEFIQTYFK